VNSESTQTAAGETGKTEKAAAKSKDTAAAATNSPDMRALVAMVGQLAADMAALRAEVAALAGTTNTAADAAEEAAAYMRVLLPEQYLALKPDEVRQIHETAPEARLKVTADFRTNMVTFARGEVIDAGDPRIPVYADRLQLALIHADDNAETRVASFVARANARQVKALLEDKRKAQLRVAGELAAKAREAADRAAKLAQENG